MRWVRVLPPLPPAEARGEGKPRLSFLAGGKSIAVRPHPDPLPEGEGEKGRLHAWAATRPGDNQ